MKLYTVYALDNTIEKIKCIPDVLETSSYMPSSPFIRDVISKVYVLITKETKKYLTKDFYKNSVVIGSVYLPFDDFVVYFTTEQLVENVENAKLVTDNDCKNVYLGNEVFLTIISKEVLSMYLLYCSEFLE